MSAAAYAERGAAADAGGRISAYWYPQSRVVVYRPQGPLDDSTAVYLQRRAMHVLARGRTRLIVNLEDAPTASSTAMQVLVGIRDEAQALGGEMVLVETPKTMLFLIDRLGLTEAFLFIWKERHAVEFLRTVAA